MGKDQEFLEAARNGNISFIEKVLSQKAKRAGPLASLRRGPGVNVQDSGGYSALHHACINGHNDIVRLLLAHEASPNLPDSRGSSPLHLAAWAGHQEIVKMLLSHPYRPANPNLQTIEHETPLHCAAQHGHTGALAVLLAHDADPNMSNTRGETPLDLAAQYGRLLAVQMLIRAHPELIAIYSNSAIENQHRSRHSSPLQHSGSLSTSSPSSPSVISAPSTPTRHIFPHTCLHLASRNGHKNIVEVLLAAGVSVNLLTPSGTALHEAALCGKESVVRTLLKAGVDLNATDAEGRTALDILKEFPPHVTKHIIAVINNFRNQMDTDDSEEVVYRHPQPQPHSNNSNKHYQKQQHNNHYHFNSNNHLLNHSHSMQQSSYNKQRYSSTGVYNGGKSLDSGLQPEDANSGGRYYHDINSPVHSHSNNSQNEMGISPSSSMSSFDPATVSPRSRSSTGGIIGSNIPHYPLSSFAPVGAPPKKPPRRNLSVSPTHTGQVFSYTSPNHQQSSSARRHQRSPSSNDSPYSHQSHGSVSGISFDENQMRDRQHGLFASARESTRSTAGISMSSSTDMLEKRNYSQEKYNENYVPNSNQEMTNSMKRPIPTPRNVGSISKEIINCENPTLKSYNPNRKLKRNRNSCSIQMNDKEHYSMSSDSNSDAKQQIPSSPTNYQQPPTPDHPPPSSSQAERTIHERIRPLSQEYKRRSALLQQQMMIDFGTSPPRQLPAAPDACEYIYSHSPTTNPTLPLYNASGMQGSSGSLSSSVSLSDHSVSTDCVEEFVGDNPFAGLFKGSTINVRCNMSLAALNKQTPKTNPQHSSSVLVMEEPQKQRTRPPIPTKPILPERKVFKPPIPQRAHTTEITTRNGSSNAEEKYQHNEKSEVPPKDDVSRKSFNSHSDERNDSSNEDTTITTNSEQQSSILSPFNAEEARKKISEIIESFGSGILNTNITPTHDVELDFDDIDVPHARHELAVRLRSAGLLHLERILFENGYDHHKFMNGVFEESDIQLIHIPEEDGKKLLRFVYLLPKPEFQAQIPLKTQQENKPTNSDAVETKGVATLTQWLNSINLPEYIEFFNKHLYNTIDSVLGVWDVELQTVLEINKLGHRRRILQSVAYIRNMREPKSAKTPLGENNETNKININGPKEPQQQPQRSSITSYRKNRPAPQPPTPKQQQQQQQQQEPEPEPELQIRAPSELLLDLPANLRTKWRHSANVLLNEQIKYEVYYLGSTVVKELRGTESTRKSIQKLKRDEQTISNMMMSSVPENAEQQKRQRKLNRNTSFNRQKRALVYLAISHRGVEFIDINNKRAICEHEIQNINCACQDSDDLRHFAYITKENDMHYCHVFNVESTDLATEIILTLGQAFEVAYQLALRDGIICSSSALENITVPDETIVVDLAVPQQT
ncbi:ankyrin repeat and sterile alpha motif domain-containing protein 1B-like [Teleopsis dalmanni]|uniref:ankyrin repeat and sterile alpha motif domain-containing protein 1B-like n=1 Tax=Teleopsis dalmanni TaxID=139649 RepID=UPI0018CC8BD9|nr:ankyrin repeat and sterile alpha motif domain-containing protein 1B-like [Teleopsis dalmanni]